MGLPRFSLLFRQRGDAFFNGFFADLCIYFWPGHGTIKPYREMRKTITIEERW